MSGTIALYELTRSLSKSEKRHFHLLNSIYKGPKNHYRLFRALEKQVASGGYHEDQLKEEFSKEAFARQLHVTKNYLKKLILKSLRQVHNKTSIDSILKDNVRDLEILFNKGLYGQSWSVLEKCKKLASHYEKFPMMLELLNWERNLILTDSGTFEGIDRVGSIVEQEQAIIQKLSNLNSYWTLCMSLIKENIGGRGVEMKLKIREEPLLTNETNATTYQSKRMYYFINYVAGIFAGDTKYGYEQAWAGIKFIESNPHQIQEDPLTYVATINNLIPICFQLGKYVEAESLIGKIKSIPIKYQLPNFESLYYRIFVRTLNHEMELYRDLGRIGEGVKLAEEVEMFMKRFDKVLSNDYRILYHYQLAYFYFADTRYSASLGHLNQILGERNDPRTDIQSYARVLNLMVHYELKNYDLIEYLCRSTRRFLNKKNRLYAFEKSILDFFKQVSRTQNIEAIKNLKALKQSILVIEEDQSEPLDFINILVWIQSKLNRDTFKNTLSISNSTE